MLRRGKGLTLGPKTTDHSGATAPDLHRLPSATRVFTLRALAAVSIERGVDCSQSGHRAQIAEVDGLLQEHRTVARDRFRQMLGDRADASEAARVLVRDQPIGARRPALGQDALEVLS